MPDDVSGVSSPVVVQCLVVVVPLLLQQLALAAGAS
jgi:hypothetical protein